MLPPKGPSRGGRRHGRSLRRVCRLHQQRTRIKRYMCMHMCVYVYAYIYVRISDSASKAKHLPPPPPRFCHIALTLLSLCLCSLYPSPLPNNYPPHSICTPHGRSCTRALPRRCLPLRHSGRWLPHGTGKLAPPPHFHPSTRLTSAHASTRARRPISCACPRPLLLPPNHRPLAHLPAAGQACSGLPACDLKTAFHHVGSKQFVQPNSGTTEDGERRDETGQHSHHSTLLLLHLSSCTPPNLIMSSLPSIA